MHRARTASALDLRVERVRVPFGFRTLTPTLAALALTLAAGHGGSVADASQNPGPPAPGLAGGEPYVVGTELAVVELARPTNDSFVLRATVPILPNLFPRQDRKDSFSFLGPDGEIIPGQNEVVTWYPNQSKGADVVEVIARVSVPEGTQPAERLVYSVVWHPHHPERVELADSVRDLVMGHLPVEAVSRDVFGHVYRTDLLRDMRVANGDFTKLRSGRYIYQVKVHEWMKPETPVAGSQGTLPHLMGMHAFVSLYDREEFFSLDLRVHNGGSGLDTSTPLDDPLGEIFFEDLQLHMPAGWKLMSAVGDPYLGPMHTVGTTHVGYPIVRRMPGGKLHLMPAQAQFQRRLMVYRDLPGVEERARGVLREEGLAFVRKATSETHGELFSWWNSQTSRYFPQNQRLPDLSFLGDVEMRTKHEQDLAAVEATLESGMIGPWPIVTDAMGWCHPWGPSIGFLHGGSEIYMIDGLRTAAAASNAGYQLHQRTQRMYTCRQPDTLYNLDGRESCVDDWLVTNGAGVTYLPVWMFLTPVLFLGDPFGFGNAPTFQQDAVLAMGLEPDYATGLREYQPIDIQHMVRYTRSLKVLAWLGNDALAKSDLRMQAELMRLSYNRWPQTPSGQAIVTGMYKDTEFVHSFPGTGLDVSRGEGWAIDTVAACYAMAGSEWRQRVYPWFQSIVNLFHHGQEDCSGVVGSVPNWNWFNSQYRLRQSISAAILENALWGASGTVFASQDTLFRNRAKTVLKNSTYAMISPDYWNDEAHAPYFLAATGPFDPEQPPFCGPAPADGIEGDDAYQTWTSLAYGYRLTNDPQFLNRAYEMAGGDLRAAVEQAGPGELENRAALLVLIQELSGM